MKNVKSIAALVAVVSMLLLSGCGLDEARDELRQAQNENRETVFRSGITYGALASAELLKEDRYDATIAEIQERAFEIRDR